MAQRGRPRIYKTEGELRKAVEKYFDAITYERDVIIYREEIVEDGKTGDLVVKKIPEKLLNGKKQVTETVWLEEPSKEGLYLHLKISKDTWAKYAKRYPELGEYVDTRMLARLVELLNTRNSVRGVEFNLKANYGWTDRVEVTHKDGGVEEYLNRLEEAGEERAY